MTPIEALRQMRAEIAQPIDRKPLFQIFFAFDALPNEVRPAVLDVLEEVFLPTAHEAARATGATAIDLHRLPGADRQLWDFLESRQSWDVLAGIDRAIARAGRDR